MFVKHCNENNFGAAGKDGRRQKTREEQGSQPTFR